MAGGSVAWAANGKGLWYTRYPRGGASPGRFAIEGGSNGLLMGAAFTQAPE